LLNNNKGLDLENIESLIEKTSLAKSLGAKIHNYEDGKVELFIDVNPSIKQHHGFIHGAIIGFMADSACAWSAASVLGDVVTSEYKINFLAPAVGEKLFAQGEVVKASSRQATCRADVYSIRQDGKKTHVAVALATIVKFKF
jgi:uncharacterized protein (TIGR00369 family)